MEIFTFMCRLFFWTRMWGEHFLVKKTLMWIILDFMREARTNFYEAKNKFFHILSFRVTLDKELCGVLSRNKQKANLKSSFNAIKFQRWLLGYTICWVTAKKIDPFRDKAVFMQSFKRHLDHFFFFGKTHCSADALTDTYNTSKSFPNLHKSL